MGFKETLIEKIIDLEWDLFQQVQNIGGPASCQQDRQTFEVMRRGQALSWSVETLESYLQDLLSARSSGRNLISEKYAHMMASTSPDEYARLAPLLPELAPEALALIDEITATVMSWEKDLAAAFPRLFKRGRPLSSSKDRPGVTSVETYLRGELATYSLETLKHFRTQVDRQQASGINGARITLEYMVSCSGHDSLEAAEQALEPAGRPQK